MNNVNVYKITSHTEFDTIREKVKHEEIELITVQKGTLNIIIDNFKYTISTGESVFINSNSTHLISKPDIDTEFTSVVLKKDFLTNSTNDVTSIKYINPIIKREIVIPVLYNESSGISKLIIKCSDEISAREPGYELLVKSYLFEIFAVFISFAESVSEIKHEKMLYNKICHYITNHYSDELSLKKIAENIHISKEYVCRIFKKYNTTPNKFINQYRVMRSCDLLKHNELSITDIAMTCGFNSISYFNKVFSKIMHDSPSSYRNKNNSYNQKKVYKKRSR